MAHIDKLKGWLLQLRNMKFVFTYNGQLCVVDYEQEFQAIWVMFFTFDLAYMRKKLEFLIFAGNVHSNTCETGSKARLV